MNLDRTEALRRTRQSALPKPEPVERVTRGEQILTGVGIVGVVLCGIALVVVAMVVGG